MSTEPRCWLFTSTFENWLRARERNIWATDKPNAAEKVKPRDCIILNVKNTVSFCSVMQVVSDWYRQEKLQWVDEEREGRKKYPYEVKAMLIKEGVASIRKLIPQLSFMTNKVKWAVYLRGTPGNFGKPIPHSDYTMIMSEMETNPLPADRLKLLKGRRIPTIEQPPERVTPPKGERVKLPPFKLDDFSILSQYVLNADRIAKRDELLEVDNYQNRLEDTVYAIFRMIGLDAEQRGYKMSGREEPDGVVKKGRTILLAYDCKSSQTSYGLNVSERRAIEDHLEGVYDEFKSEGFARFIFMLISHSFEPSALRYSEDLSDGMELRLRTPVRIALLTTRALRRILERTIADGLKESAFGRLKGLVDEHRINELW